MSNDRIDTINPATDKVLANVAACDVEEVNRAVAAGRKTFEPGSLSRNDPAHYKAVLLKLAELNRENFEEVTLFHRFDKYAALKTTKIKYSS